MILHDGKHTFEVVEAIPQGFRVWNIGNNMMDGFLPLCQLVDGTYNIIPETLKALKVDDPELLKLLREGAGKGIADLKSCKKKMNLKAPKEYWTIRAKEIATKTISFYETFTEGSKHE